MNLHGYKKKKKNITRILKIEIQKQGEKCLPKVRRLQRAKYRISKKIRQLRKTKTYNIENGKGIIITKNIK